jgi:hypothetical protein
MFKAYFDASYNDEVDRVKRKSDAFVLAGWVSTEERWAALLCAHNISRFSTSDFETSGGEFQSWRGDHDKRRSFVLGFIDQRSLKKSAREMPAPSRMAASVFGLRLVPLWEGTLTMPGLVGWR